MKWLDGVEIGWRVCTALAVGAWALGATILGVYWTVDEWRRAREWDHAAIMRMLGEHKTPEDWLHAQQQQAKEIERLMAAMERLQKESNDALDNTRTHCYLGSLPRLWCEDQGHKVLKDAPLEGAGGR